MDDSYANVTATVGGGQSALPTISATNTRLAVVTTAGDSVTLPRAAPGLRYRIKNASSNSANVFPSAYPLTPPQAGDSINVLAANAAFALGAYKSAEFVCMATTPVGCGIWDTFPTVAS
jgi:hypothetical protein